jgi:ABC-type antimicrobial peptide transport system permease subunit
MFRHNLLISYRNFLRYKQSFFINLIGLSTGLACTLLILLWVNDELSVDQFHKNDIRLYQVLENVEQGDGIITRMTTAGPTAEAMASEMPEVEMAVTTTFERIMDGVLTFNDTDIKAGCLYASKDFFKMFSFELVEGIPAEVLSDKKSIVITEDIAMRLFGTTENVVGKMIEWEHKTQYQVSGVMKDIPAHSSVRFDYVLTIEDFKQNNEWVLSWFNTAPQTHILLKAGTDVNAFNNKIADFVRIKTEGRANHRTPFVQRYSERYLHGKYENGVLVGGRIEYVKMFSIIAVFILLIACINFMNLSTARASRRLKEVGVKKVVGAKQSNLVAQYLSESILMSLFALFVALLIVWLFLPQFNTIAGKQLTFTFSPAVGFALLSIVLITGLLSGSYPALYLSSFGPATVLKGKFDNFIGEVWARKGLVVFQFTLSIVLIVSVWVVYEQISFIQSRNLGYDKENVIMIPKEGAVRGKEETFLAELQKLDGVAGASAAGHDMTGHNGGTYGIDWPGKDPEDRTEFENLTVDFGFTELMGMDVKEGRTFSKDRSAENEKIIFNEAAVAYMNMKDPVGKKIKLWGEEREIIGVVKDFNFESFHEEIKPLFFRLSPEHANKIMVKIEKGSEEIAIGNIQRFYSSFNAGFPLTYRFLDQDYQELYAAEQRVGKLSKYFAGLAILISCLGLFGLAAFTTERRIKEIGIRKILGSTNVSIVYLLSAEFTKMILAAIAVALPLSYYFADVWLKNFAFRIDLQWWFFAASGLAALVIAWITVGIHTMKAASTNPSQCLRSE